MKESMHEAQERSPRQVDAAEQIEGTSSFVIMEATIAAGSWLRFGV